VAGHVTGSVVHSQDHHGSHRHLLWSADTLNKDLRKAPHAIIVPTVRRPAHLAHAANLAAQLECPLVTLHSGKYTNAKAAAWRLPKETDLLAIDILDPAHLRLPDFETSSTLPLRFVRRADTSAKRNLALILSHLLGWQRIVFLDDDIFVDDVSHLEAAAGLLSMYSAVGLSIGGFPDNSVVCHAYRDVGGNQESFIGGGALAVEMSRNHSFFPNIYNEDWFYLLDAKKGLQQLAVTGAVRQRPYDPYRTPGRARAQEFGDVLAEGVFWLLDQSRSAAEAGPGHWMDFLARRERFIAHVLTMVEEAKLDPGEQSRMVAALKAAKGRLAHITPRMCQDYLRALSDDQERWRLHIEGLEKGLSLGAALRTLTKPGCPTLRWEIKNHRGSLPDKRTAASSTRSHSILNETRKHSPADRNPLGERV